MCERAERGERDTEDLLVDKAREGLANENGLDGRLHEGSEFHSNEEELEEEVEEEERDSLAGGSTGLADEVDEELGHHDVNRHQAAVESLSEKVHLPGRKKCSRS